MNKNSFVDQFNAFIQYGEPYLEGGKNKPLSNLTFGLKDVFDVEKYPTGFGSPDWLNTHPIPNETASIVHDLVRDGATLIGKTHTDELTYSILGINAHYGTPINPLSPQRVPGGSSSGSAVSVAGKLVDFAVGSDTGGSVRTPASFCGIYGIRPTYGKISLDNARPLARSFDTLGWFSRDPEILYKVGKSLLKKDVLIIPHKLEISLLTKAWEIIPEDIKFKSMQKIREIFKDFNITESHNSEINLSFWANTFRIIQASEIWQEYGDWATKHMENFGPGIKDRFLIASQITSEETLRARESREVVSNLLNSMLNDRFLLIPTVSNIAPLLNSTKKELEEFRQKSFQLLCIAGLGGLPQISLPIVNTSDGAFGISLVGPKDSDMELLNIVKNLII